MRAELEPIRLELTATSARVDGVPLIGAALGKPGEVLPFEKRAAE